MSESSNATVALLFTDIEGSTRLWEQHPEAMRGALAQHDAIARETVAMHRGTVVKMTGDGVCASFHDPGDALNAGLNLQLAIAQSAATAGIALRVRCGLHVGIAQPRDGDFFGTAVNRAARIMSSAHGGQVLLSQAMFELVRDRLPAHASLRDLGNVRLRDLTRPERLFQLEHPALTQDFPSLRSLDATPNNLPEQLTSFIGRGDDIDEVARLLAATRLLTLVGPGGIGKTRLSLQVAASLLERFPDGVWLVELAALTDPALVVQAAMQALSVREEPGKSLLQTLVAHTQTRQLLIVLDNCEHLLAACADLAHHLLRAAPGLRMVATSREALRIAGEQTYSLSPLALPDAGPIDATAAAKSPAVQLFADRAQQQQPGFALTPQNVLPIIEICRRLDGIPLALELAAARVRALPVDKIAERLNNRFQLLTGGSRTALPRQRTLAALIEWSYDLLTEVERTAFTRLSVFAGGWTLEAAERVCSSEPVATADVLNLVTDLTEKSLVAFESRESVDRYRMLQTIREFARDKLARAPDGVAVRERHLDWCLALAREAEAKLPGSAQGPWLSRLDRELENLLSAHAFCAESPAYAEKGLDLVALVRAYWINRGLFELGSRLIAEALARAGAAAATLPRARALFASGQLAFYMGDYAKARGELEETLAIARSRDVPATMVMALSWLGHVASAQGEPAEARGHLESALSLARKLSDRLGISVALNGLAEFLRAEGDFDAAIPLYEEGLALNRALSHTSNVANALLNLAAAATARGDLDKPVPLLREALTLAQAIGSRAQGQFALDVIAGLTLARARWEPGVRVLGASEAQLAQMGLQREPPDERFIAPMVARARAAMGEADFAAAHAAGQALSYDAAVAEAAALLAQ